eukprot:TRINITY_DN18643_c0_g1_i1.p1 TRINITY_DN18643_c0_g1~~TRINITY_DN18643_c0_g1_i1.p1  ORF type:complete len:375 (+),score=38.94 TRINITY_DN18643_c0_g1_i1:56-1126(+)
MHAVNDDVRCAQLETDLRNVTIEKEKLERTVREMKQEHQKAVRALQQQQQVIASAQANLVRSFVQQVEAKTAKSNGSSPSAADVVAHRPLTLGRVSLSPSPRLGVLDESGYQPSPNITPSPLSNSPNSVTSNHSAPPAAAFDGFYPVWEPSSSQFLTSYEKPTSGSPRPMPSRQWSAPQARAQFMIDTPSPPPYDRRAPFLPVQFGSDPPNRGLRPQVRAPLSAEHLASTPPSPTLSLSSTPVTPINGSPLKNLPEAVRRQIVRQQMENTATLSPRPLRSSPKPEPSSATVASGRLSRLPATVEPAPITLQLPSANLSPSSSPKPGDHRRWQGRPYQQLSPTPEVGLSMVLSANFL